MTLWIVFVVLCLVALAFVVLPLYRGSGRPTPLLAAVIVLTVVSSAYLYNEIGAPGVPSGAGSMPDASEMIDSLAKRLESNPADVEGWILLARSYQSTQRYDEAISAYEKAMELEQGQNADTMIGLGIALTEQLGGQMSERSASLFENAVAMEPSNANALFYAGSAAAQSGNTALAADRWEALLGMNVPPDVQDVLRRKISEWRGVPLPVPTVEAQQSAAIVSVNLSLSDEARSAMPADALVMIIARDPAQPSPPIAGTPRRLAEIPMTVDLSDGEAMMAGRPLSGFAEFEVLARVSLSGGTAAQPGDWFGSLIVTANNGQTVDLVINQKVP